MLRPGFGCLRRGWNIPALLQLAVAVVAGGGMYLNDLVATDMDGHKVNLIKVPLNLSELFHR